MKPLQAIRNAVQAEHEAARFYSLLAEQTPDSDARSFLDEMAKAEVAHAHSIEKAGEQLLQGPLADRANMDVSMIETLPDWRVTEGITLEQAVEVALAAEHSASLYYDAIADLFEGPVRQFFIDLSLTEEQHAEALAQNRSLLQRPQ